MQRVIFTSGYSAELAGKAIEASDLKWFLQKPTEPSVLFDTIRRCLRAEAGSVPRRASANTPRT
jgi:hypothetical protein